jgi:diguanylate cyclase (GGDEF)-like protein
LRSIARALLSVARRPSDLAARFGGEEFAIILPDTDADAMQHLLATLLESIRALAIEHAKSSCAKYVSISAGAITVVPDRDLSPSTAIEAADQLLYDVKRAGRNHAMHADLTTGAKQRVETAA